MPSFAQTWLSNLTATQPTFVALDTRGSPATTWLYVAEHGESFGNPPTGGGRILRFNLTSGSTTPQVVANRGTGTSQFISPDAIVVDSAGDIYVSDRFLNRITKLTINQTTGVGTASLTWGTGTTGAATEMHGPVGLALDSTGALYVAEHGDMNTGNGGNFVSKYTFPGGVPTRAWRNANTASPFNVPYGIAVSGANLLISDGFNARVQIWDLNGNPTGQFAIPGTIPLGLSIDATGALWIAESSDNGGGAIQRVERRTASGTPLGISFGSLGSGNGQFILPFHAVANSAGTRLYVADYGNSRVQIFDLSAAPAPVISSATTASGTVGTAFSYQITASGSPTSYAATGLPAGLTVSTTTGAITGTPTAAGTVAATISATNASGTGSATLTFTIAAAGGTAPVITSATSASATVGTAFNYQITASNSPTSYAATGLPAGLTVSPTTGAITGTPTAAGTASATISATNATGTGSSALTITVAPSGPPPSTGPSVTAFAWSGSDLTFRITFSEAVTGVDTSDFEVLYFGSANADGPAAAVSGSGANWTIPFTWNGGGPGSIYVRIRTSGTNITGASGAFTGAGIIETHVPVTNSPTETVAPTVLSFTPGTAVGGVVPFTINFSESVRGFNASDVSLAPSSTGTATINGIQYVDASGASYRIMVTPTSASGTIALVVRGGAAGDIRDAASPGNLLAANATSTSYTITGGGGPAAPVISSATTASATVGTAFSYQITASGSPTSFAATGLPAGLTVSTTTGAITGTPTAAGTAAVTISATNATGTGSATLTITTAAAGAAPVISSATTASATVGTAFSYQITASGSPTSYSALGLPAGLTVSATTGAITGTPTTAGTAAVTISASNASGTGSATLTITVGAAGAAPVISSPATASATAGTAFSYQIAASGSPTSFGATGLPTTLTVNTTTGLISGTPTAAGTINATVSATNATGTGTRAVTITVAAAGVPPVMANQTASGTQNQPFSYQVVATGATSFAIQGTPALPAGLSMSAAGAITGTPTAAGTTTVTVRATNAFGTTDSTVAITVAADNVAPTVVSLAVGPSNSSSVNFTLTFSERVTGVTADDFTLAFTGGANATGTTVTPVGTAGTTYNIALNYTGVGGSTVRLTLRTTGTAIADLAGNAYVGGATASSALFTVPSVPVISGGTISGTAGVAITPFQVVATGSPSSFGYIGSLAGLSLNSTTGVISGTPTSASNSTVTITATNGNGTGSGTLTLNIAAGSGGGGGGGGGGVVIPPTFPPITGGGGGGGGVVTTTVVFAPVSGAVVDQPINLSATASSGQSVTFTLVSGNATLVGNVLTPKSTGAIIVRATAVGSTASAETVVMAKAKQTITFNSPVSAIQINTPIQLSATSSVGAPITFTVVSGNATISGNTLTPKGPGAIVVRATASATDTAGAASTDVNFGSPQKSGQSITIAGLRDTTVTGGPLSVTASATSGLPVTLAISGPARISGNSIVLTGGSGTVTVRASQAGNDIYNAVETVQTFAVRAIGQQVYLGTMGSDAFAVVLSQDNSKGVFVTRFAGSGEAIVGKFRVNADGSFRINATGSTATSGDVSAANLPSTAALVAPRTITGTVNNGVVTGSIAELGTEFTANIAPATGTTSSLAGVYIASIPGSASGETYIVAGPNGTAYAVAVTPFGVVSGTGTISADGAIDITTSGGGSIIGSVDANTGMVNGTLRNGTTTAALVGISEGTARSDRLVNLSSRLRVVSGDANRSVIAGFVISGTENKDVLVRAIGPGLAAFGVTDALANPRLQLYNSAGALVAENDDWTNTGDISATADRVGAFRLAASSRDSAIMTNLAPGAYTAVVTGVNSSGVALIEVYDAATNAPLGAQQLVNISTRGFVDTGEGNLIAGFVVTGNAPKRVLVRGIGPSLTQFGLNGAVSDPSLKIYAAGSSTVIAQNDDWSTPQSISASQAAATAADIAAASTAAGAFPLAANSRDSAIVITLMPGAYSAVVSGANNATGAGLVEVYELSNQ